MTKRRILWMRALHAGGITIWAMACALAPVPLDPIGEGYVRAALQLAQHDPDLVEAFRGDQSLIPGPRVPVARIAADVGALRKSLDRHTSRSGTDAARADYLDSQLRALDFAAARLLGRSTSLDEQARDEFAIAFSRPDLAEIEQTLAAIDHLIPGPGSTVDRVTAFRKRLTVPDSRKESVLKIALDACRDAVAGVVELPQDERVAIRLHKNMPWDAFARYEGDQRTTIEVNNAGALDVSRALRLACHEGYAGHHAQHLLIDRVFRARSWPELQLTPSFGPHLLFMEGAAEVGADLALPPAQRAALYRDHLFPAASLDPRDIDTLVSLENLVPRLLPVVTDTARQYLDSAITQEQAIERLSGALISNPQATLAFIERRRARALVYGEGRRAVYARLPAKDLASLRGLFQAVSAIE